MQVAIPIREKPDLKRLDEHVYAVGVDEHRRDHHEGARTRRQSPREIHARQQVRRREQRRKPVHHAHGRLARGQQQQRAQRDERGAVEAVEPRLHEQQRRRSDSERGDRTRVEPERDAARDATQRLGRCRAHAGGTFQPSSTLADQVATHVRRPAVISIRRARTTGCVVRKLDGHASDVAFGHRTRPGNRLDGVPVPVARRKVHRAVDAGRIFPQLVLDDTHRFDELAPVERAQQAQAADRVADRHLSACLFLRLHLHELVDREPRLGQPLLDPREWQRQCGALPLQPTCEFRHE